MLTGSTRPSYYNGGEWPELTRTVLSVLYLAIIANDEEEGYHSHNRHNHHGHCYDHDYCDEELEISLGGALRPFALCAGSCGPVACYRHDFKDR